MDDLEHLDWSFGLVVALVTALVAVIVVRYLAMRRKQRRAEKRARHTAYREWLHSSGVEAPESRRRKR